VSRQAQVTLTLDIEAELPERAPENVVRTVPENARTLKFKSAGLKRGEGPLSVGIRDLTRLAIPIYNLDYYNPDYNMRYTHVCGP
jgi:hypothetical protein